MKKYLVLVAILLAACGEQGTSNKDTAGDISGEVAKVTEVKVEGNVIKLTAENSGAVVSAKVGQELELQLAGNATTGYNWQFITFVGDENMVEELQSEYIPDENPDGMVGVGGKSVYRLKLLKAGEIVVSANYVRSNEEVDINKKSDYAVKVVIE